MIDKRFDSVFGVLVLLTPPSSEERHLNVGESLVGVRLKLFYHAVQNVLHLCDRMREKKGRGKCNGLRESER